MILTFKIKHFAKLDLELEKAIKVAIYAISCRNKKLPTSKDVKEFKLKSVISNQILRKYHSQKKLKSINTNKVKLTVPGQDIKFDKKKKLIKIVPLKIEIKNLWFDLSKVEKINQIELDKKYAYITATCTNKAEQKPKSWIGIDLNSTSNTIVTANSLTGNVKKYGKEIPFLKKKYKNLRRKNQINGNLKLIAKQSKKERNKTKDILQKITTKIVKEAVKTNCGLKIENLKGISKHNLKKYKSESNHTLNSWPFYEIRRLLKYKSLLLGVKLEIVDPAFTSQSCFQCKQINKENRKGKIYKCSCGHLEHSDANAAFNISLKECFSIVPSSNLEKNDKVLKTGESVFYTLAPRLNLPLKARVS